METWDSADELCALLDELPLVRTLASDHPRRVAWMAHKRALVQRLEGIGPDRPFLQPVRDDEPVLF